MLVPAFTAQARPITNEDVSAKSANPRFSQLLMCRKQYARYLEQTKNSKIPASWAIETSIAVHANGHTNGYSKAHSNGYTKLDTPLTKAYLKGKAVRTLYGLVPLEHALDWPVFASYDELAGCASWMGGRIPTVEEARSIYSHVDGLRLKEAEQHLGKTVPAVNG